MNYRSKIFILTGIYGLIAAFVAKLLFSNYYIGESGLNVLPINFFELVIFSWAFFTFLISLITMAVLVKKRTQPFGFKKRFNFLISTLLGWIIIFLLMKQNMTHLIVPVALLLFGSVLLNLNRFVTSRLVYFGLSLMLLGVISFFLPAFKFEFLILGFGIFPIVFGVILMRKMEIDN